MGGLPADPSGSPLRCCRRATVGEWLALRRRRQPGRGQQRPRRRDGGARRAGVGRIRRGSRDGLADELDAVVASLGRTHAGRRRWRRIAARRRERPAPSRCGGSHHGRTRPARHRQRPRPHRRASRRTCVPRRRSCATHGRSSRICSSGRTGRSPSTRCTWASEPRRFGSERARQGEARRPRLRGGRRAGRGPLSRLAARRGRGRAPDARARARADGRPLGRPHDRWRCRARPRRRPDRRARRRDGRFHDRSRCDA